MIDLSILVVSYNTRELTLECLRSIVAETTKAFEVLVVDNASSDGSADAIRQEFPQVHLIALDENLGFARANNLAAQSAQGEYLILLNPDTVVLDGALNKLYDFMEAHPDAGACGGRNYLQDGSLDPGSCWGDMSVWSTLSHALGLRACFPRSALFDPESLGRWKRDSVRPVDIIAGCLLIIRRSLWNELGGFDPRFFMYCEDADLCLRIRQAGYLCWLCPDAKIIHYCGASETVREDKVVRQFCAKSLFFQKHWSSLARRTGIWILSLHAWVRMVAHRPPGSLSKRHRELYDTWRNIWHRRQEWTSLRFSASG